MDAAPAAPVPVVLYVPGAGHIAKEIASAFRQKAHALEVTRFASGEIKVAIPVNVNRCTVILVAAVAEAQLAPPTFRSLQDGLWAYLCGLQAAKGAKAERVLAYMPMLPYARQDRKCMGRESQSALLWCSQVIAWADHVVVGALHAPQLQNLFPVFDEVPANLFNASAVSHAVRHLQASGAPKVVVSPDTGGNKAAEHVLRSILACPGEPASQNMADSVVVMLKTRSVTQANTVTSMKVDADGIRDRVAFIVDDMADTCGTLCGAVSLLKENGAARVVACVPHAVLSGPALERLHACPELDLLVVFDTCLSSDVVAGKDAPGPEREYAMVPTFGTHRGTNAGHLRGAGGPEMLVLSSGVLFSVLTVFRLSGGSVSDWMRDGQGALPGAGGQGHGRTFRICRRRAPAAET